MVLLQSRRHTLLKCSGKASTRHTSACTFVSNATTVWGGLWSFKYSTSKNEHTSAPSTGSLMCSHWGLNQGHSLGSHCVFYHRATTLALRYIPFYSSDPRAVSLSERRSKVEYNFPIAIWGREGIIQNTFHIYTNSRPCIAFPAVHLSSLCSCTELEHMENYTNTSAL